MTAFCLFLSTLLVGQLESKTLGADLIRAGLTAKSPEAAKSAWEALMRPLDKPVLASAKTHSELPVALHAAWEEVRHDIRKSESDRVDVPDRATLGRFVGFLEGRLNRPMPEWWMRIVCDARSNDRSRCYFRAPRQSPYTTSATGIRSPKNVTIDKREQGLIIRCNGREVSLETGWLADMNRRSLGDAISVANDQGTNYVVAHTDRAMPCTLARFGPDGKCVWVTDVWAGGGLKDYGGQGFHYVAVLPDDSQVLIVGAADDVCYIESFSRKTGKAEWRFSTGY